MLLVVSSSLRGQTFVLVKCLLNLPDASTATLELLLELREEKVDVVCGAELRNEGLDVLQEDLQPSRTPPSRHSHTCTNVL